MIMESIQLSIPKNSVKEVTRRFIPEDIPEGSEVELIIRLKSENLTVREFSNYLSLIDKFYGRLFPKGVYSYGHSEIIQLRISEIRSGSIETIIKDVIDEVYSKQNLVIVFLLMKYIPNIIKSSAEAAKNIAESFYYYEKAKQIREKRKNRKNLREALKEDEKLHNLEKAHFEQLVKLLDSLYAMESKKIKRIIKTVETKVESINLRIKKMNK